MARLSEGESIDDLLEGLCRFLKAEVIARHVDGDVDAGGMYGPGGRFSDSVLATMRAVRMASAAAGYYDMFVPTELGGGGLGMETFFRVWETIYYRCGSKYWLGYATVAHWARGPSHILVHASERVRDQVLPEVRSGDKTLCFAMSEPDAGSDAWNMRTSAMCDGRDSYVINGTKQWITNAPYADYAVVFAVTNPELARERRGGVTAFLVPTDSAGFRVESVIKMFGHDGGDEGIVSFTDVVAGEDQIIGDLDQGFRLAMEGVSMGRLYNAARAVGLAQWALEAALTYAGQRETFGRPIIENQGVSFPLADSAIEIHAARLMGLDCARLLDAHQPARLELAMTKTFATEMSVRTLDRAMQVHGAMGFTNELGMSEAWQQSRRICVADGSAEILRRQIVHQLRKDLAG